MRALKSIIGEKLEKFLKVLAMGKFLLLDLCQCYENWDRYTIWKKLNC